MLPYLAPRLPGELTYSRFARTVALTPENSIAHNAIHLLDHPERRFGIILPTHGDILLSKVPPIANLDEADFLAGSLFPAIAPFLDHAARERLRCGCMSDRRPSVDRWLYPVGKRRFALRYCPACALEDHDSGVPLHWRTCHQHPGSSACARHRTLLIEGEVGHIARQKFFNPSPLIDMHAVSAPASPVEVAIAEDLTWLLGRKNSYHGRTHLRAALQRLVVADGRYVGSKGFLPATIARALHLWLGSATLKRIGCWNNGAPGTMWSHLFLDSGNNSPFQRYSLVALLLGKTLQDIFDGANESVPVPQITPTFGRKLTL